MKRKSSIPNVYMAVALSALFVTAAQVEAQEPDQSVFAGQRVGVNKIGDSRDSQLRDMGKPGAHYALPGGISVDSWGDGQSRAFYNRGVTVQISTRTLVAPLPGNITMEATVSQVLARHPGLKKREYSAHGSGGGIIDYYDDQAHGIAFEFTHGMSPAPDEDGKARLYAVVVHKMGMAVIPDVGETPARP